VLPLKNRQGVHGGSMSPARSSILSNSCQGLINANWLTLSIMTSLARTLQVREPAVVCSPFARGLRCKYRTGFVVSLRKGLLLAGFAAALCYFW